MPGTQNEESSAADRIEVLSLYDSDTEMIATGDNVVDTGKTKRKRIMANA